MIWTRAMDALLVELRSAGESSARIAKRFKRDLNIDISRNAVVGRAHRLKLGVPSRVIARKPREFRKRKPERLLSTAALPRAVAARVQLEMRPLPPAHEADIARLASIVDLEPHHCKFPVGEPLEGFCGDARMAGLPYCAGHAARCYDVSRVPTRQSKAAPNAVALLNVKEFVEA